MAKPKGQVACARLAAECGGVLTRDVALLHLTPRQLKRQLDTGAWVRLFPGVFRVEGVPLTWEVKCTALAAWLGPRGVLSHRTAARIHGLELTADKDALDVTAKHRLEPQPKVTVSRRGLGTKCTKVIGSLVVTTVARTLMDLAAVLDADELEKVTQQALRKGLVKLEELARALDVARRTAGVTAMRALLTKLNGEGVTESELEDRVVELLEAHQIPRPKMQRRAHAGKKRVRLDFVFTAQRVIIEADGYAWHSDTKSFETDRARDNALTARGFRVLRWTWKALDERPDELITELLVLLNTR